MVRFGLWDDILAEPEPDERLKALTGGYLYARATALAAKGRLDEAKAALAALQQHTDAVAADDGAGLNAAKDVFAVAILVVKSRIAAAENKSDEAIALLTDAVVHEDQLAYDEPADWYFPVRHLLGAALLKAGRPAAAEAVYREDLRRYPANGWALYGLAQALAAQGQDAGTTRTQFARAWALSDVKLTASAF
jgi:tetratricopeptide (TPR) repeat protein